ncbi:aminotransferase class I/II-fold pyridoxal phosphate-dependent enzyme [Clostridium botulinum]|uniref:pyridoxal phosphate-dependent aminotransferase n=1 Tax=unclassified Clostridium TaxID=2614128 RepID=UPI000540AEE9|nr:MULTISPECIES: aminotransferase class I/II-fold pyridoxal phosphate-dependent enzyme [unclassified Clostridium]AIY81429.1 aminotransferase class I and II family protein [Clostridium botulinum 202F]KAI3346835.1 aminotransferase class I/II-fold pyridoxal phosphate-dependent enzyme [Clostridium botulinum]KON13816.1 aspartate aminotransferase [Clostridium botulinum]MBY6987376.1 aminotransferase class I/II-fold pyridoxal phosphate-dependent enzyme [Clostridium botulinum]MBY7008032.1 aminotransfer
MNNRVEKIQISGIRRFYEKVQKVEGAISLTIGQPDFNVPIDIKKAMIAAIEEDKTTYTSNSGIEPLRLEISKYLKNFNINYNKDEICITVGGSEGLYSVLSAILNEGDKILIPSPAYPAYESISNIIGADVINYSLNDDFTLNIDEVRKKIKAQNVKYLLISFPSNPTGAILSKENKGELIKLIKENDITVITDEMYSAIIFDEYHSVAQDDEILDKVIYVSGFSKIFSMTGLRIGYVACKSKFMKEIMKVHQYAVSCAPSIVQWGALEGLKKSLGDVEIMKESFKLRKEYCIKRLEDMGIEVVDPKGAFYIFPSIKKFNMTSEEFCTRLLNEEKLACVPGDAFGKLGEGYMRISYCYSEEVLCKAFNRLEKFIKKIAK